MYQREAPPVLKAFLQEISEDYLGVTLIRSGDSVIIDEWSVLAFLVFVQTSRVEPR